MIEKAYKIKNNPEQIRVTLRQKVVLILFGIFMTLVIIEVGLRLAGLMFLSLQEYRNAVSLRQRGSYRIMCLGESTTSRQYPYYLEKILNQRNIGIEFSVVDKGVISTNIRAIVSRLEDNLNKYKPDMVVAMIGINDWGGYVPYGAFLNSKTMRFLESFRLYKLARILWLHLIAKFKETGFYRLKAEKYNSDEPQHSVLSIVLRRGHAEGINPLLDKERFKKTVEFNPRGNDVQAGLGWLYQQQGEFSQAEESFKKAIELNPENGMVYAGLGWLYQQQGKFSQAEESFKKAIELNSKSDRIYAGLGWLYQQQGKFSQAEESFKKAIELNPESDRIRFGLGWLYQQQGKLSQAEESFKKAIELNPESDRALGALAILYKEMNNPGLTKEYHKKAEELRLVYYNPIIVNNYQRLKQILDRRGIKLVCVQYPMRRVEPLKKIFEGQDNIIFVDNEKAFKEAVNKRSYKEYFKNIFAGDFGHCTSEGNRLLAENIANVILREVFKK